MLQKLKRKRNPVIPQFPTQRADLGKFRMHYAVHFTFKIPKNADG